MKTYLRSSVSVIAIILGAVGLLTACDNPVDSDGHDEPDVYGLVVLDDDQEILRVQEGATLDTFFVPNGSTTPEYFVRFIDQEGEPLHEEDLEEDFELRWEVEDPSIVSVRSVAQWNIELEGLKADTTNLEILLFHLGEHDDFTTPPIPVVVR